MPGEDANPVAPIGLPTNIWLNMAPGEPYRQWFHNHILYNHYSLGEATEMYNE